MPKGEMLLQYFFYVYIIITKVFKQLLSKKGVIFERV